MPAAVAFILKGYPRLSETFIAQEIQGLERLGLDIRIYSLRPPRERERHPIHGEIAAPVVYLPERLWDEPRRVLRALLMQARRPGFGKAARILLADMARLPSLDRLRRFCQAAVLAAERDADIDRLHAHFLHSPATVARYASAMTGCPWSCSAHAKDVWTISEQEKRTKLKDAAWMVTCTAAGHAHLTALAPSPERVSLAYHGLDLDRFPAPPATIAAPAASRASTSARKGGNGGGPPRDGSDPDDPVRLLSVGRAVEKKGFDCLLEALAALPPSLHWRWTHIGAGELLPGLKSRARRLRLDGRIDWLGARAQTDVIACYRSADLFVLPSRVAGDGDRDGLPNVLLEAQSQALCCLSTRLSAIPELIEDGRTGLLVEPDEPHALRLAVERLIRDPALRERLGRAGAETVRSAFSHCAGLVRLAELFRLGPERQSVRPAA